MILSDKYQVAIDALEDLEADIMLCASVNPDSWIEILEVKNFIIEQKEEFEKCNKEKLRKLN